MRLCFDCFRFTYPLSKALRPDSFSDSEGNRHGNPSLIEEIENRCDEGLKLAVTESKTG